VSLQDELARELGVTPTIRWGRLGQFDVFVNGTLVFSRKTARRLPLPGEVVRLSEARR
jgi:hypothetical protein